MTIVTFLRLIIICMAISLSTDISAQDLSRSFDARSEVIARDTEDKGECVIEATFDAEWGLTSISFDIPEVAFKMKDMKFHFLKTDFNMKTISFDVPKIEWGTTNIGNVKLDLPKIYRKRIEIKTKIPEFTWDITSIKTKIPEFKSKRVEWKFHILKIGKLKEASIPCKEKAQTTTAAAQSMEALSAEYQETAVNSALQEAATAANEFAASIGAWGENMDQAVQQIDAVIGEIQSHGGDPNNVLAQLDGESLSVMELRATIVQRFQDEITRATEQHSQVVDQLENFDLEVGK